MVRAGGQAVGTGVFGSEGAAQKLLALRFFSPPLTCRNGCRFGFSLQAQSWTEMLTLMCLTQRQGLSDRDAVHAPRPGSSPGRRPDFADSH